MSFPEAESPVDSKSRKRTSVEFDSSGSNSESSIPSPQESEISVSQPHNKKRKIEEQKAKHNLTSKRGRQRINSEINALKDLLPECRSVGCHKVFILSSAVSALKKLQTLTDQLQLENAQLKQEVNILKLQNSFLLVELNKLKHGGHTPIPNLVKLDTPKTDPISPDLNSNELRSFSSSGAHSSKLAQCANYPCDDSCNNSNADKIQMFSLPPQSPNLISSGPTSSVTTLPTSMFPPSSPPITPETFFYLDPLPDFKIDACVTSDESFNQCISSSSDVKSLSTLENDSGLKALTSLDLPPELSGGSALSHPCEVMPPHTSLSQLQDYAIPNIIPKSNNYTFSLLFILLFVLPLTFNSNLMTSDVISNAIDGGDVISRTLLTLSETDLFRHLTFSTVLLLLFLFFGVGLLLFFWICNFVLWGATNSSKTPTSLSISMFSSSSSRPKARKRSLFHMVSRLFGSPKTRSKVLDLNTKQNPKSNFV